MDHSDYKGYSLEQLYEALDTVDEANYPGQRTRIESRIEELEGVDSESELNGIGGWLILVAVGLVTAPFRQLISLFSTYPEFFTAGKWQLIASSESPHYNPYLASIIFAEIFVNGVLVCFSVFLIYLFFAKKPMFPTLYIGITVFSLIYVIVDAWAVSRAVPNASVFDSEFIKDLMKALIGTIIWVPYMLMSKRVKATFR